jgi:hypothetical protein
MNDLRILRDRLAKIDDALDVSTPDESFASAALVAITTTVATYPTSAGEFFACHPSLLAGAETEGATPTFADDANTVVYALNLGSAIPPSGTRIVCHSVGGRWAFRFDG